MFDSLVKCRPVWLAAAVILVLTFSISTKAQSDERSEKVAISAVKPFQQVTPPQLPLVKDYKKVSIGMPVDELKDAWGKPKIEDKDGLYYELEDSETAQIRFGPDQKVTVISITFAQGKDAPTLQDVFGQGAAPDSEKQGAIYKLVRYPEAGYWVAYYAGPGPKPTVTLTLQKL